MPAKTSTITYTVCLIYYPVINNSQLFTNKIMSVRFSQAALIPCCFHPLAKQNISIQTILGKAH